MTAIIKPGAGVLFMKIGTHAQESLAEIIDRKRQEIKDEGFAMWGYGGNTCHPTSMVQPFAKAFEVKGKPITLVMHEMDSKHYADKVRAEWYSPDGVTWKKIPPGINVLGSKYALVIKRLREADEILHLAATKVAVGPNLGRVGSRYVRGQADKACLEVVPEISNDAEQKDIPINLVADLIDPYAVFLREPS